MKHGVHWRMTGVPEGYTICGVPVRFDPENRHVADARGLWPRKWIAVGTKWLTLPFAEQEAVLLHEAGHALKLHLEVRLLLLPFFWTAWMASIAKKQELAADAFAVKHDAGFGLYTYLQRNPGNPEAPFHPAPYDRMKHLSRLILEKQDALAA
jgi:Zn-dependent protease with chaperone function